MNNYILINKNELMHYGILGQKWGIRRYQNEDGSLTQLGKEHYAKEGLKLIAKAKRLRSGSGTNKIPVKVPKYKNATDADKENAIEYYREYLDNKWVHKNYDKVTGKTYRKVLHEMNDYVKNYLTQKYGKNVSLSYLNEFNSKLANLMNKAVGDVEAPSGKVVQYVAKRGEPGVHMALADRGYDMSQLKNGVWDDGRIAYKKEKVNMD